MSRELLRLSGLIYDTPHLVTEEYLDKVSSYIEARNSGAELTVVDLVKEEPRKAEYFKDKKLGVIEFNGAITDIPHYSLSGGEALSHQMVREQMKSLVESGAKVVVMDMDTPGGIAHMAFESARYIRDLADDNGVKLISYVSAKSFSAGMVYSAVAHEIISNPSAEVGSIGVRVKLRNMNGALKNMGVEDVYITAGENKVPFDSGGNFTEEYKQEVKDSVLELYDEFTDHVAMYRGMSKEDVIKLGANSFSSKKALSNGLIDKVMTLEEFKSYLEEITTGDKMASPVTNVLKQKGKEMSEQDKDVSLSVELEAAIAEAKVLWEEEKSKEVSALSAELESLKAQMQEFQNKQEEAKQASRLSQLSAVLGDVVAAEKMKTLSKVDDEVFSTLLSAFEIGMSAQKENDAMLNEFGDEGVPQEQEQLSYAEKQIKALQELNKQKGTK